MTHWYPLLWISVFLKLFLTLWINVFFAIATFSTTQITDIQFCRQRISVNYVSQKFWLIQIHRYPRIYVVFVQVQFFTTIFYIYPAVIFAIIESNNSWYLRPFFKFNLYYFFGSYKNSEKNLQYRFAYGESHGANNSILPKWHICDFGLVSLNFDFWKRFA